MRRLLCVTAHPDDEAGNFGGTLAKLASLGVQTCVICLTAGEAARHRGRAGDNEELADTRSRELARSCELLHVSAHQVWSYPDSKLSQVDFHEATGRLVKFLREFRPQVVLAFGPEGGVTAHPDHGMAGLLTTAAFHFAAQERPFPLAGKPVFQAERLYYSTGVAQPAHVPPVLLPPVDIEVDISAFIETKIAAFKAHVTQTPLVEHVEQFIRAISGGAERYHLAAAPLGCERALLQASGDLFHGCQIAAEAA